MTASSLAIGGAAAVTTRRQEWFAEQVPWHRVRTVVDITHDSGRLIGDVMLDFEDVDATVIDLSGNPRAVAEQVQGVHERVNFGPGDVLSDLPCGADYYLLPDHLDDLDTGRLGRLMQSVSRACLPSGRAIACVGAANAMRLVRIAERAGLEVTRQGGDDVIALIEFGSGPLRALPNE